MNDSIPSSATHTHTQSAHTHSYRLKKWRKKNIDEKADTSFNDSLFICCCLHVFVFFVSFDSCVFVTLSIATPTPPSPIPHTHTHKITHPHSRCGKTIDRFEDVKTKRHAQQNHKHNVCLLRQYRIVCECAE